MGATHAHLQRLLPLSADPAGLTGDANGQGDNQTPATEVAGVSAIHPPVDLQPVDLKILVDEAEAAHKNTGESTGDDDLPSVEFYYGKVMQNGRWIKTGKIYWIYTTYQDGDNGRERKRLSPTKIYGKRKGLTSIDHCPHEGRVIEFRSRSLSFKYTGDTDHDGRLQDSEDTTSSKLASQ